MLTNANYGQEWPQRTIMDQDVYSLRTLSIPRQIPRIFQLFPTEA